MLLSIDIKNVALISHLKLDFERGLNILSGETGAGKSVILDSLMFALGTKADKGMIRFGEKSMSVEAVFDANGNPFVKDMLKEMDIEDELLIIYRSLNTEGRSVININGRTVTLSMLKEITPKLIDIYSQSEHISLLKPSTHIGLLDGYCGETESVKKEIGIVLGEYKSILSQIKASGGDEAERERLIELYNFQIDEIEKSELNENEEEELNKTRSKLINIERITEDTREALKLFSGERGLNSLISSIKGTLNRCSKYDGELVALSERLDSAAIELDDIYLSLNDYIYNLEFDSTEAERVEKRLEHIKNLKRKYGNTISNILNYLESIQKELNRLISNKENIKVLLKQKDEVENNLYGLSKRLSEMRKSTAEKFGNEVLKNLNDLSMGGCGFKTEFNEFPNREDAEKYISSNGMDKVEFYISTNKGEPLKPLAKIISGGEMSRFMLAIKTILSDTDDIDTLVFDEIDTGISGITATAVAKKFASIAKKRQIIAITHLPQIASMADVNFLIEKKECGDGVQTYITKLDKPAVIAEVSRLIGSADISKHGKLHAEEMINWSAEYKKEII